MGAEPIGVAPATANADATAWASRLHEDGYCIIPDMVRANEISALADDLAQSFDDTALSVGPFYGDKTKRFHSLLRRSPNTAAFVAHPLVLAITQAILEPFCDRIQLNLTQAIEILPGGKQQPPHRDQDMWPIHSPGVEYLVNAMWPFTPYTDTNGATRVWPGSHRRQAELIMDDREAVVAAMNPGSVLMFLGSTLHAGGANRATASRRGMIVSYSLGWLKPYELPWLAYPPEVASQFSAEIAELAGYKAHRPNLGTFEGRCPSMLLSGMGTDSLGALDTLRPEQEQLIAAWRGGLIPPGTTFTDLVAQAGFSAAEQAVQ